jgi:nicotinamide riboside kinase
MKVINIFGGPGAGKSTTAAGVFHAMKKQRHEVELVTEYAKDMTWEGRNNILTDQLYVLAKQNRRLHRLRGQVDYIISDSPLVLGLIYAQADYFDSFHPFLMDVFNSYKNINIMLSRDFEYNPNGRNQTADEATQIDTSLQTLLQQNNVPYYMVTNDPAIDRVEQILHIVSADPLNKHSS